MDTDSSSQLTFEPDESFDRFVAQLPTSCAEQTEPKTIAQCKSVQTSHIDDDVASNGRECRRCALITGINGQTGSYLAELLISKGYIVHGMVRRESSLNSGRLMHLYDDKVNRTGRNIKLHYGDLTDSGSLFELLCAVEPHEVYNLAAQSHVKISFDTPEMTGNTNALGTLRLLEAIRKFERLAGGGGRRIKFYHASTSELFGGAIGQAPQNESTAFHPRSPYACSKLYAHWLVVNYRESYGMYAVNGILFNHESPRRGENFVTRKITRAVAEIKLGRRQHVELGNLDARRDWGHARDYVEAIWLMMNIKPADVDARALKDYVISSGESHTVREFVTEAFAIIGLTIEWRGADMDEQGCSVEDDGVVRVKVNNKYLRPAEVHHLWGDSSRARKELNWTPRTSFKALVREMVLADLELLARDARA